MTSPCRGSARSARCLMPMTAMADQGHSDGLTALRDRDLDDLDRHCSDPDILSEKRIGYMVGDRLNQREMEIAWDRLQGSISKIQIVLGEAKRSLGRTEEQTSELQSLIRISYAVFCLQKKINGNYYKY